MTVACIIPAYNEAGTIGAVVQAVRACRVVDQVIVVSDGSTDDTAICAGQAGADRVIVLPRNEGKTRAILRGAQEVPSNVLLVVDADLCRLTLDHVERLLAPVLDGAAEMAVAGLVDDPLHGVLGGLSGQRAFRRELLRAPLLRRATGFGFELALDRVARQSGAHVVRVPLAGVTHRRKREKYGTLRGLRMQVKASADLVRQTRSMRRPTRRSAAMEFVLVAAAVMMIVITPLFLAHPSHAAVVRLPHLPPLAPSARVLVVVAHPDDEVIGAGGLIAGARRMGVPVTVVVLTNGDGNRLTAAMVGRHARLRPTDFMQAAGVRQRETRTALRTLGDGRDHVLFVGFPDRMLKTVMRSDTPVMSSFTHLDRAAYANALALQAVYTRASMVQIMQNIVAQVRPTIVVTHAPFDRHPDHQAAYELVRIATRENGTRIYTFLVHAPGFPRPFRFSPQDPLVPPPQLRLPAGWAWRRLDLPPEIETAKQHAVHAYHSQLATPYLHLLLTSFVRTNELYALPPDAALVAPAR